MDLKPWRNPLVVVGGVILFATVVASLVATASLRASLAQTTVPCLIGVSLIAYGRYAADERTDRFGRTILRWTGYGLLTFLVVGFWFGVLSRTFDTSFLLAIVASLGTGAAVGALVGLYSARLKRANEDLAAKNEQLDQFLSVVSHDLRNPLNVAEGRLELAAEECDSEHLEPIDRSLDRMDTLIDDLLTLARQGEEIEEIEPVDLATVSERCWDNVATADASLVVDADRTIEADRSRLQQLLENLFRNAIEHGGDDVRITVGELADGFYVADDGPGISQDKRGDVFESGYTTASDGTGFGLAIVAEIVGAHGWEVDVTESDEGGARFEITGVGS
ncbi:sensor histidine kinase [Halobellus ordinarius]|uniref:sensor histidine kinase n=1 Tax=Halobellus ordinarius TaxID=3075120 RepID=UPI002880076E|nr:HAMP domain-containing sensor histidine kinase [Halobellus sp. ZY16]